MKQRYAKQLLVVLAMGVLIAAASPALGGTPRDVAGSYVAFLDLGPLGDPRIETLYVILDQNGSLLFTSEHEADKESPGVGAWERLGGGTIGWGAASFRYGPDPASSICALIGVDSPPGNCVLKIGGKVSRQGDGTFAGEVFLTIENLEGTVVLTLPPAFSIAMRRAGLEDFPGASP